MITWHQRWSSYTAASEHGIKYKLCTLYQTPHWTCTTVHFVQLIAESSRRPGLRFADTADYIKRRTRTKFGERCFSHAAWSSTPAAWNSVPDSIKLTTDTSRFKHLLKTHLFHLVFWHMGRLLVRAEAGFPFYGHSCSMIERWDWVDFAMTEIRISYYETYTLLLFFCVFFSVIIEIDRNRVFAFTAENENETSVQDADEVNVM